MAHFFNPEGKDGKEDLRLHAPATARNRDVIFDVLKRTLPKSGMIFEVASGTGEHAAHIAPNLPHHIWQPSDIDPSHLESINAWRMELAVESILPARHFDVLKHDFGVQDQTIPLIAVLAINLIHISPWNVTETLIEKASKVLEEGSILYFYGPFKRESLHTSESNEQFDASLKSRNENWGIRDMEAVTALAEQKGFDEPKITPMPANNFSLAFKKLA